ncbi:MAG: coproporphyrinogen dehydrogenase HemZ, partial [Clostridia bacterium]|nr:coproporphyrinogen dehydrogenase HemZ [Clostridia bacterium]
TKLARSQGAKWRSFFTDLMCVSEKKTALTERILEVQKPYIVDDDSVFDLFVSIPLCPTRCEYCSFISEEISKEKSVNEYIEALIREIESAKALKRSFRSVYVGGGTPVALTDEDFERVLEAIGKQTVEYTVEAGRPDAITEKSWK